MLAFYEDHDFDAGKATISKHHIDDTTFNTHEPCTRAPVANMVPRPRKLVWEVSDEEGAPAASMKRSNKPVDAAPTRSPNVKENDSSSEDSTFQADQSTGDSNGNHESEETTPDNQINSNENDPFEMEGNVDAEDAEMPDDE